MEINPSSNDTIISQSTAGALGLSDVRLAHDPWARAGSTRGYLGWLHRSDRLRIAGDAASRPRTAILPAITDNVPGVDFFQNKVAPFDFAGHRLQFQQTGTAAVRPSLFSDVITRNAGGVVIETTASRRCPAVTDRCAGAPDPSTDFTMMACSTRARTTCRQLLASRPVSVTTACGSPSGTASRPCSGFHSPQCQPRHVQ